MAMILACLDVHYVASTATAACILFDGWRAATPAGELVCRFPGVEPYVSGSFFRRELPCLTGTLDQLAERPETILIDGYVWLGPGGRPGLGAHLYDALGRTTPVVGVAKSPFPGAPAVPVLRGRSRAPLYITAAGVDAGEAAQHIREMAGPHRIPEMLKRADLLCREAAARDDLE